MSDVTFPMLQQKVHGKKLLYFDSAATTLKPQCVIDAVTKFYSSEYSTVNRAVYATSIQATEKYEDARRTVQQFINGESIIFTRGTTESINLVAASFPFDDGDEVLISEIEHHANIVPWQLSKATLKVAPVNDDGHLNIEKFKELLTPSVKLVSLCHISNALGTLQPIEEVIRLAHANGSKVFIDGAQAAAHLPIDVKALDVDFYAFSGHKVYGPTGIGVLYGKKEALESLSPYQSGGDMIDQVTFEKTTYREVPFKFEAGTPNVAGAIGLAKALNFLSEQQNSLIITSDHIKKIPGAKLLGKSHGTLATFTIDDVHSLDIGTMVDFEGVAMRTGHLCAQTAMRRFGCETASRISLGIHNTEDELQEVLNLITKIINKLR